MCAQCFWGLEAGAVVALAVRAAVVARRGRRTGPAEPGRSEPCVASDVRPVGDDTGETDPELLAVAVAPLAPGIDPHPGVTGLADEWRVDGVPVSGHRPCAEALGVPQQLLALGDRERVPEKSHVVDDPAGGGEQGHGGLVL